MVEMTYKKLHSKKEKILREIDNIKERYENEDLTPPQQIEVKKMISRRYGQIDLLDNLMKGMEEETK